jgi:uncharacterized protein (DUF1697 family)
MERLRALAADIGLLEPRTYLQSGNLVFESRSADPAGHARALERELGRRCGVQATVLVRSSGALRLAVAGNPLAGRPGTDPRFLHATFLSGTAGQGGLAPPLPLGPGEEAVALGDTVYLYLPNGYGGTRMNNAFLERRLGLPATTRNWRTVCALERMAAGGQPPP